HKSGRVRVHRHATGATRRDAALRALRGHPRRLLRVAGTPEQCPRRSGPAAAAAHSPPVPAASRGVRESPAAARAARRGVGGQSASGPGHPAERHARGDPGRQRAYGVVLSFAEGRADPRRAVRDGGPAAPRAPALRVVLQSPAPAFGAALSGAGGLRVASCLTRGVNETEGRSRGRLSEEAYVCPPTSSYRRAGCLRPPALAPQLKRGPLGLSGSKPEPVCTLAVGST